MNECRVYVYFKPNMRREAREWIQKYYGKEFKVQDKVEYVTSVPAANPEETRVNNEIQDYILERLKEVCIDDSKRRKTYSEIVQMGYTVNEDKEEDMEFSSEEDTCKASNKSREEESLDELETKSSKSTVQSKAFADLQETVKLLQ